jgi:hypothetical protein
MSNDTARRQGWTDAQQNRGPMNTNGWDRNTRNEYEAEYQRRQDELRRQQNGKK